VELFGTGGPAKEAQRRREIEAGEKSTDSTKNKEIWLMMGTEN
jgi:hypothetical protein